MRKRKCNNSPLSLLAFLLLVISGFNAFADDLPRRNILLVGNGYYSQEDEIIQHLEEMDLANLTTMKDYHLNGSSYLDIFDLIIVTGFAPNISNSGIQNILNSGVPVLIVEYWDFIYSYEFGLTNSDYGFFGDNSLEKLLDDHPVTNAYPDEMALYDPPYYAFGVGEWSINSGVTSLVAGPTWGQVSIIVDETRKILATGLHETQRYTDEAWALFDSFLDYLAPIGPDWSGLVELSYAYETSGLKAYIESVKANPGSYTDEEVALYVYRTVLSWNLFDMSTTIALDLFAAGVDVSVFPLPYILTIQFSPRNTVHHDREMQDDEICDAVDCHADKIFMGENLDPQNQCSGQVWQWDGLGGYLATETGKCTYTPSQSVLGNAVLGADGGASVRMWNGTTIVYLGDSEGPNYQWGFADRTNCGADAECNDPIAIIPPDESIPGNGIDSYLLLSSNNPNQFVPLTVPGINQINSSLPAGNFGPFTYPPGADIGVIYHVLNLDLGPPFFTGPIVVIFPVMHMWFATQVLNNASKSYLACSVDGLSFHNCYGATNDEATLFSEDKFILADPVAVGSDIWHDIDSVCVEEDDPRAFCGLMRQLRSDLGAEASLNGMLVFGARGGPNDGNANNQNGYRESPLFLGYIVLGETSRWYYTGSGANGWVKDDEGAAQAIISDNASMTLAEKKMHWFGEFSVRLIKDGDDNPHLVMLANHPGRRIYYRSASLFEPDTWSEPEMTCAVGYGPYIIDAFTELNGDCTEIEPGQLTLYHAVQGWTGYNYCAQSWLYPNCAKQGKEPDGPNHEAYGVFTTQLRMANTDGTCDSQSPPPVWPPQ